MSLQFIIRLTNFETSDVILTQSDQLIYFNQLNIKIKSTDTKLTYIKITFY
jgi:hypothetical protein